MDTGKCIAGSCLVWRGATILRDPRPVLISHSPVPLSHVLMPYVLVRESLISTYSTVEGLPPNEAKILGSIRQERTGILICCCFRREALGVF